MTPSPTPEDERARYYRAALTALRFVEARRPTGRRFGADADARWASFKGDLTTADRIDLLLADADAEWPGAFAARAVFAIAGVAGDDPFGAAWRPLDPVDAEEMWRAVLAMPPPADPTEALESVAAAWDLAPAPFHPGPVGPADQLVIAGPGAVIALAAAFAAGADLAWADQVTVVASPPAHRHLASTCAAVLHAPRAARLVAAGDVPASLAGRHLVSSDAHPADSDLLARAAS